MEYRNLYLLNIKNFHQCKNSTSLEEFYKRSPPEYMNWIFFFFISFGTTIGIPKNSGFSMEVCGLTCALIAYENQRLVYISKRCTVYHRKK